MSCTIILSVYYPYFHLLTHFYSPYSERCCFHYVGNSGWVNRCVIFNQCVLTRCVVINLLWLWSFSTGRHSVYPVDVHKVFSAFSLKMRISSWISIWLYSQRRNGWSSTSLSWRSWSRSARSIHPLSETQRSDASSHTFKRSL